MDSIRSWLTCVVTISLLSSTAVFISEKTSGQKYVKFLAALAVFLTVTAPILKSGIDISVYDLGFDTQEMSAEPQKMADEYFLTELSAELSARTEAEAVRCGIECDAEVICIADDGAVVPIECRIYHSYNEELDQWISKNLEVREIIWIS